MYRYTTYDPTNIIVITAVACSAIILLAIAMAIWQARKQAERRRQVLGSEPVSAQDFLANWRVGKRGSRLGYASLDRPGCYVILTNPVIRENGDAEYDAVYVGQSVHVCACGRTSRDTATATSTPTCERERTSRYASCPVTNGR